MLRPRHIPGNTPPGMWERKWLLESVSAIGSVGAVAFAAYRVYGLDNLPSGLFEAGVFLVIWSIQGSTLRVMHAHREDAKATWHTQHEVLYAAVSTLQAVIEADVRRRCHGHEGIEVRATFHRLVPPSRNAEGSSEIEQLIPYVGGSSEGTGAGRKFSIHVGITGQAIRNCEPYIMSSNAESEQAHKAELIAEWGYSEDLARSLAKGRYSALAVPVLGGKGARQYALGVIYLDANARGVFDDPRFEDLLLTACDAIADFVTRRY